MKIDILTLFPEMFTPLTQSIVGRAAEKGILKINLIDIRDYSLDKHRKADDYPFGGGAGMVMLAQPIFDALRAVGTKGKRLIYMSPRGKVLDAEMVKALAEEDALVILCGHYEGVDQRVLEYWNIEEISIGDYILTGGELPAMVLVDSVSRMLPDVLSSKDSALEESIYSGLLEYPQYTKPREFEGLCVPEVLVSGDHQKIALWKLEQSLLLTKERRPDLFAAFLKKAETLRKEEKQVLLKITKNP